MPISPAREALNTPVKRPSVLVDDMPGPARVGLCVPAARGIIVFRRVPNYTGGGGHRFHADFTFDPDDGSEWRGHVVVYQLTPDGAEFPRFETTVYRNGRMLPEGQLSTLRDAALQAYAAAFPWCNAGEFKAWAEREHGATPICDSYGTWGRAATVDGKGFTYRGETGNTAETLACLVEDIRAGVEYVNPEREAAALPTSRDVIDGKVSAHEYALARGTAATEAPPVVRVVRVVDVTPTWAGLLPAMLAAYENGTAVGRGIATEELTRMARVADAHVAAEKESKAAALAARERFNSDVAAAPAPGDFPDVAALLGPRERGNPSDVFNMTETEARAVVWAWSRVLPGLVATPATAELGGEHTPDMGYGLTIAGRPGAWLWISRAAVAHAVAMAKASPIFRDAPGARPGLLPDCMRNGHNPDASGRYCRDCGADIGGGF